MFDGLKFAIFNEDCKRLIDSSDVPLVGEFDRDTNIAFQRAKGRYKGLRITVKSDNYAVFSGSIHKFGNAANGLGEINSDQFTFEACTRAIFHLCDLLRMEPNDIRLMNLECGLNLHSLSIPVSELIERAIMLGSNVLKDLDDIGRQSKRSEQRLKFYDKGLQCGLGANHRLRVELASIKMRAWQSVPIITLGDLLQKEVWQKAYAALENQLSNLVFAPNLVGCENLGILRPSSLEFLKLSGYREIWAKMPNARARRDAAKRMRDIEDNLGLPNVNEQLIAQARAQFSALISEKSVVSHSRVDWGKSVVSHPLDNKMETAATALALVSVNADGLPSVEVELDRVPAIVGRDLFGNPIVATEATPKRKGKGNRSGRRKRSNANQGNAGGGLFGESQH